MTSASIVVLGAGPAGAALACGLARLGYGVSVVSDWRRFHAVEGISARVLDGLRHAGLARAAACARGPYPRTTRWNGATRTLNAEFLLERNLFDAALREDLARAGVAIVQATVRAVHSTAAGHRVVIETDGGTRTLHADFLVEARGRQAPHRHDMYGGMHDNAHDDIYDNAPDDMGDMHGNRHGHPLQNMREAGDTGTGNMQDARGTHDDAYHAHHAHPVPANVSGIRARRDRHGMHDARGTPHATRDMRDMRDISDMRDMYDTHSPHDRRDVRDTGRDVCDVHGTHALLRGPQTLSLACTWPGPPDATGKAGETGGAVESLAHGWSWMARLPDGRRYWQIALDVDSAHLPRPGELAGFCQQMRQASLASRTSLARAFFGHDDGANAHVFARSSTAMLDLNVGGANWLRVGDAAMAVDPLSGNGIFQALSSALQAGAVVHTLLAQPERAALALRFHRQRIAHLFMRFARTGRDFYALERQWPDAPFWRERRAWPDNEPLHPPPDFAALKTGQAPVIDGDLITEARVVISPDQPLGMWHLQGIELAPIVDALRHRPAGQVLATLPPQHARPVREWLATQGYPFDPLAHG